MLTMHTIQAAASRVAEAARFPSRIVLFGSYARGTASEDSDLDLLVIEQQVPDKAAEYLRLRSAVGGVGVGVDVIVVSEQEALERSAIPGTLLYWATQEGQVLHDSLAR
jgi:predicted nucleotidyltransferase